MGCSIIIHSSDVLGNLFLLLCHSSNHFEAEGIAAAKAKGVHFGPQPKSLPDNFEQLRLAWRSKKMSLATAAELCGIPRPTFNEAALRAEASVNRTEAK